MIKNQLLIATRKSPLALWQAQHVCQRLQQQYPDLSLELVEMTTQGDKILDAPLAKIGGKGLFVKELEQGLLEGKADIAVHSMKDVPVEFPDGLHLPVILQREDPRDAFVSNHYQNFAELPQNATVGTSSLRRQAQLLHLRPDLNIQPLRGNVGTRLRKLDEGQFDAIVLASAGLKRLELAHRITAWISPQTILPAIGQGAMGIECRLGDTETERLINGLDDPLTHQCIQAERAINQRLAGGCQVPIAGFAEVNAHGLLVQGRVADPTGHQILASQQQGFLEDAERLGNAVAEDLLAQGAEVLLRQIMQAD